MYDAIAKLLERADGTAVLVMALILGSGLLLVLLSVVICQVASVRKHARELEFKREMLIHGVPAEEIERTLAARNAPSELSSDGNRAKLRETQARRSG